MVRLIFSQPHQREEGMPPAKTGEIVLVVDDDLGLRDEAEAILRGLGYEVLTAASPAAALRALSEHPDTCAMITDLAMPGMSGPDLAERARAIDPEIAVVLTTGLPDDRAGSALVKPYTRSSLASWLREVLDLRQSRLASKSHPEA